MWRSLTRATRRAPKEGTVTRAEAEAVSPDTLIPPVPAEVREELPLPLTSAEINAAARKARLEALAQRRATNFLGPVNRPLIPIGGPRNTTNLRKQVLKARAAPGKAAYNLETANAQRRIALESVRSFPPDLNNAHVLRAYFNAAPYLTPSNQASLNTARLRKAAEGYMARLDELESGEGMTPADMDTYVALQRLLLTLPHSK